MHDFANINKHEQEVVFEESENFDDSALDNVDFSNVIGKSFKKTFPVAKKKISNAKAHSKPSLGKKIPVRNGVASVAGRSNKSLGKVIVPRDRKLIVEGAGMNRFLLSEDYVDIKRINYHDGHKLKEVILSISNNSGNDITVQLFNPSEPLDYLYSTSQNINDLIKVADSANVSYTDLLHNILANPLFVYNAKIVISGSQTSAQSALPLTFTNKNSAAHVFIKPRPVSLMVDNYQKDKNIVNFFQVNKQLNRPFIPDGMDVIQYQILAGSEVTIVFFCQQKLIKRMLYKEEINGNRLLI